MIAIGCDHAGVEMKKAIIEELSAKGFEFRDMGTDGEPCDYPVIAEKVCKEVLDGNCEKGYPYLRYRHRYVHCCK